MLLAAATSLMLVTAAPAGAIIGGTDDTQNRFPYVGVLQLNTGTDRFDFCPGTLVAPDIVLTASHCTDFFTAPVGQPGLGPDDLRVSFALPRGRDLGVLPRRPPRDPPGLACDSARQREQHGSCHRGTRTSR